MLIICYFVFLSTNEANMFLLPLLSNYTIYPIPPLNPLYLIHLIHPFYLLFPLSPIYLIHPMHPLFPMHLLHPLHPHHLFLTITTTAPIIRMMPMARLTVKGSLNTKMPMSTAVSGSKAPKMAVAVEPTYLAA